jgi:1,2-dihydroxy-3-keto-5-methylthiopentene dioxygenase
MQIKTKEKTITSNEEAKKFLDQYGLHVEFWKPEVTDSSASDALIRFKNQIEGLKKKFGYASADVCELNTTNPNLDKILEPFMKEHHHSDDEVRFTVEGEGIFGVNPGIDPEFEVCVEAGDLLMVPANTRHWFKLTDKKNIKCIRIFKDNPKWEAIY